MKAVSIVFAAAICIFSVSLNNSDDNDGDEENINLSIANNFLSKYGYMSKVSEGASHAEFKPSVKKALKEFQEYYKLPTDEEFYDDTFAFIMRPRCGNEDILSSYSVAPYKWEKKTIYYYLAYSDYRALARTKEAFQTWGRYANLKFAYKTSGYDILITFQNLNHSMYLNPHSTCQRTLDGRGGELAHANFPTRSQTPIEIHMDWGEAWYFEDSNIPPADSTSYYAVLVHEIGHALGLEHSKDEDAIMFPYITRGKHDLSADDIVGIRKLYPNEEGTTTSTTTTTTKTTSTTADTTPKKKQVSSSEPPDLCAIQVEHFLILNKRIYMFYKHWVWISALGSNYIETAKNLFEWLPFLPKSFERFDAIYQKPNSDIIFFSGGKIYIVQFPSLQLLAGWPQPYHRFGIPGAVNAAFNTYSGRALIYHGSNEVIEFDDCNNKPKNRLIYSQTFPYIPNKLTSVFKYIDGYLYFIDNNNKFYKYSEFSEQVTQTGILDLSLFKIHCANKGLLEQLYDVLSNLIKFDKHVKPYLQPRRN
ncbi:collagenase 3-like [Photinus pyralis]|uniref:collagenase 3-like n=1 Tax=Photinus pyralis TaxID=7054 RepID=UPI0012673D86|nr:collagenase 3-like [Photinus pyralis]